LNEQAKGIPGCLVPNSSALVVLRAGVLHFTTDQPGGDKLCHSTGSNSYVYSHLRDFKEVYMAANSHIYCSLLNFGRSTQKQEHMYIDQ